MEREGKQQSSKGSGVGVGIACSVIGAIIGAVGYHIWTKQEEVTPHSHSEPKKVYNHGRCPICLSEMEQLRVLPCGHQYHDDCMKQADEAKGKLECPLCRKEYSKRQ